MQHSYKAFSLLEIIFAIVIIGILASIAMPKLFNTKTDALVSTLKQDIVTVTSSIQSYYLINEEIETISDTVSLNSSIWEVEEKRIVYNEKEQECVKIELVDDALEVNINEEVGTICQKLYEKGIRSGRYVLK